MSCDVLCYDGVISCSTVSTALINLWRVAEYIGCYVDKVGSFERDLSESVFLEQEITVGQCEQLCARFKYFGLQYGSECWCDNKYGKYGPATEAECDTPCTGDESQKCGGNYRNSIYQVTIGESTVGGQHEGW